MVSIFDLVVCNGAQVSVAFTPVTASNIGHLLLDGLLPAFS